MKARMNYAVSICMGAFLCSSVAYAGDVKVSGQVRKRTEISPKNTVKSDAQLPISTKLRSRIAVDAMPTDQTAVHIEFQDSRMFGGGAFDPNKGHVSSIGNTSGVDLHQGWFQMKHGDMTMRVGRQKQKIGSQRFLSSLEWHQNARVFDGFHMNYKMGETSNLSAMLFVVNDKTQNDGSDGRTLAGFHYGMGMSEAMNLEVYAFNDNSRYSKDNITTVGERFKGTAGSFFYEEEFLYQLGTIGSGDAKLDMAAMYVALRLGMKMGDMSIAFGWDMMSGDDDAKDDKNMMYKPFFYFAHAYFGYMDYFVANKSTGVSDYLLEFKHKLSDSMSVKLNGHYFSTATDNKPFGSEVDIEVHASMFAKSKMVFGFGAFMPGDIDPLSGMTFDDLKKADKEKNTAMFAYAMAIYNF